MSKQDELDALARRIVSEGVTPELAATATNLVPGDGNPDAAIVFIGEAPGKAEDLSGRPFVGASGKLLDEMLASVNLQRSDIYITNIVKYRPPDNRDPTPAEKAAFWPFLLEQLTIIQPKIIVTLGRHSMENFLPGEKITTVHGNPQRIPLGQSSVVVVPLYHPAAALYNGGLRQTLLDDFQSIPAIVKQIRTIGSKGALPA